MMRQSSLYALVPFITTSVYAQLTPWDNQIFDFGWSPYNPTIPQCSTILVGWNDRDTASPHSQPPYTLTALYGGTVPIQIATVPGTAYNWTVELPVGGPYILNMKDSAGYTGGDSLVFQVQSPTAGTCGTTQTTASSLQLSSSGTIAECSAIVLTATGGAAPYTMQIIAGERPPKTSTWTTSMMSYTIDMQPSEQFFVIVTDANGNTAVDGIHTVTAGDTSCYGVATTVVAGSLPTTLSYNPSSIPTFSQTSQTSASGSQSAGHSTTSLIQNTDTATVTSVVTLADGSKSTYTLAPGASVTVVSELSGSSSKKSDLPAIIGGAAGGGALIIIVLIVLFMLYRRAAQRRRLEEQRRAYEQRRLSGAPLPMAATQIQPFMTNLTPNRESAPLMGYASTYSSGIPSVVTPAPSADSYFGSGNNLVATGSTPWANPETNHYQPNMYSPPIQPNTPHPTSPPMSITSLPTSGVSDGIPPGAMAPMIGGSSGLAKRQASVSIPEKASFAPVRPATAAPPPYSHS